jgi:serine/threonine-protein kinase
MDSPSLLSQLAAAGLLPQDEATRARVEELSRRHPAARDLARELLRLGLLTPYQANQLLAGKGLGLVVGSFLLLERLGEGGMGHVFKARHRRMNRVVALKVIRPERVGDRSAVQRFCREVEAAAKLSHPNIVRAYDAGEVDGVYYFSMQYVPGTDLSRLVKQRGGLPGAQVCDYLCQAAFGLQHIHDRGLVHRDIKPGNLMITGPSESRPAGDSASNAGLTPPGVVRILDLGLARLCEEESGAPTRLVLTKLGAVMGTADYISPEQARDSREADVRSDLYSLGCTFYFALAGRPPFPEGGAIEKLMQHQLDEAEPIERLRPDVPPALAAVLRRLMAKKPADRYQSAAEVVAALEAFSAPEPPAPMIVLPAEPIPITVVPTVLAEPAPADDPLGPLVLLTPEAVPHRGRRPASPWVWVATGVALALGLLSVLLVWRMSRG